MNRIEFIFVFLIGLFPCKGAEAQNLIPNSSFEEYTGCPGPNVFLQHTLFWKKMENHAGTPDQFLSDCPYNKVGQSEMAKNQFPHSGNGFIGLFAHGDQLREYAIVKLKEPLVAGRIYEVEFWVRPAAGYGTVINSLGIHFSVDEAVGPSPKSLAAVALAEHVGNPSSRLIDDTQNWTAIRGTYLAQGNERYVTLGNFRADGDTQSKVINQNCIRSDRSYMLIDDVSVKTPPVMVTTKVKDKFSSLKKYVDIFVWDHEVEDGDSINIYVNDKMVLSHYLIRKKKKKLKISLEAGSNLFKVEAINLGRIPPNTVSISISDKTKKKNYILNSTLKESEAIEITY